VVALAEGDEAGWVGATDVAEGAGLAVLGAGRAALVPEEPGEPEWECDGLDAPVVLRAWFASGSAATSRVILLVPDCFGGLGRRASAACDGRAEDELDGPTYWTTTGPWCWPHQSPTNTAPAPVTTANAHAPAREAVDICARNLFTSASSGESASWCLCIPEFPTCEAQTSRVQTNAFRSGAPAHRPGNPGQDAQWVIWPNLL
jgi:hypothetical protein